MTEQQEWIVAWFAAGGIALSGDLEREMATLKAEIQQ